MRRFRPPFRLWPLRYHITLAALAASASVVGARVLVGYSYGRLADAEAQLKKAREAQAETVARQSKTAPRPDFTQTLPLAARAEVVVRNATQRAQELGIDVTSLSVERRSATQGELGQSRLSLTLMGSYPVIKVWLSEMQAREQALAVESLTLRRTTGMQQEAQLVFVLFTRD